MDVLSIKPFSTGDLAAKLRHLTMLQDRSRQPYQSATIQVADIGTPHLSPAQLYVQRSEFEKVRDLRWLLLDKYGVDILRLADRRLRGSDLLPAGTRDGEQLGYIEMEVQQRISNAPGEEHQETQTVTLLPPVVEVWAEADGSKHNIINDGLHRCYLARICRVVPAVVRIEGIPKDLPYYAYPAPEGWRDVTMVERLGSSLIKKHHRMPHPKYKEYYRDFNSVFTNVGGPRGGGLYESREKRG